MSTQKRKFLYQPAPLTSAICWSWTLIIFFIGIIIWLEITHFQWITLFFLGLFCLVSWAEIRFRTVTISNGTMSVSRLINPKALVVNVNEVKRVSVSKHQIGFVAKGRIYHLILPANSVIELNELITND